MSHLKIHFTLIYFLFIFNSKPMEIKNTLQKSPIEVATFAGGCFWCTEAIFQQLKGVKNVISGYTGGKVKNPTYKEVCSGLTKHAEAIQITYDATKISFQDLLEVFFYTHNPTTLNRQGNDIGSQYRSAVFYHSKKQKEITEKYIKLLNKNTVFDNSIVTEVNPFTVFYNAEDYHQDYYKYNKNKPYCELVISPKVQKFMKKYSSKLK